MRKLYFIPGFASLSGCIKVVEPTCYVNDDEWFWSCRILSYLFTSPNNNGIKNLFFLLIIVVSSICISCNNEGGMSATAKKNLEVNEAIMKAYEAGDFSKMSDYIAADAVDHGSDKGYDVKGLDSIVAEMKRYKAMMPDMKSLNTRSLADDEYVLPGQLFPET